MSIPVPYPIQALVRLKGPTSILWTREGWKQLFSGNQTLDAHVYLSQVRVKCSTLWLLVIYSTRSYSAYFTTHAF